MKTTIYFIAILAFSALMLSPKMPKEYPPKEVLKQRESIVYKESKIERLIDKVQYELEKDSIEIRTIKNN